jgi:hypothetical protein
VGPASSIFYRAGIAAATVVDHPWMDTFRLEVLTAPHARSGLPAPPPSTPGGLCADSTNPWTMHLAYVDDSGDSPGERQVER